MFKLAPVFHELLPSTPTPIQEAALQTTAPLQQHTWLLRMVGSWTFSGSGDMGPDQPPHEFSGVEEVRGLGNLWIVMEGRGAMPDGTPANTLMTLGYDTASGKFVGTWVGSMMTHLFTYEGSLDDAGRVLTLDSVGPSFAPGAMPGTMARYQDIIEQVSENHRILRSRMVHDDGTHTQFMEAHYHRAPGAMAR